MVNLPTPKIDIKQKSIVKTFHEVGEGLTILFLWSIVWLPITALLYNMVKWLFL
jgi:hypothetical protein